jgi:hypothetical protein
MVTSVHFVSSSTCIYALVSSSSLLAFGSMIYHFVILSNKISWEHFENQFQEKLNKIMAKTSNWYNLEKKSLGQHGR